MMGWRGWGWGGVQSRFRTHGAAAALQNDIWADESAAFRSLAPLGRSEVCLCVSISSQSLSATATPAAAHAKSPQSRRSSLQLRSLRQKHLFLYQEPLTFTRVPPLLLTRRPCDPSSGECTRKPGVGGAPL